MKKKISYLGIFGALLYAIVVAIFLISKNDIALTVWEVYTIASGIIVLLFLVGMAKLFKINNTCYSLMLAGLVGMCVCTSIAHLTSIVVTRPLIASGVSVPEYFLIGKWPSYEMAIDYLGWGLFMGLSFISLFFGIKVECKMDKVIRITVLVCGILCLVGFVGGCTPIQELWYFAPWGYGFGIIVLGIMLLKCDREI